MSSSKAEKTAKEEEDDLVASVSKTMTVDKLKEHLKNANVSISGVKKKADYVNLYISNGLHKGEVASSSKASKSPGKSKNPSASVSKAEKTKEEETDLIASISKTMTIPQLKKEIILADLWYGTKTKAKTKEDFVNIYISNGLHKRAATSSSKAEIPEEKKAPKSPETSPPASVSKAVARVEPKEELIMSLMINGHGIEGLEWDDPTSRIAQFYKNNVRVYSRACVPGIPSVRIANQVRKSIDQAFTIFKNNPGSATQDIMSEYTGQDKNKYRNFLDKIICNDVNNDTYTDIFKNKERCGGLITYLSQKQFFFDEENIPKVRSQYKTEYDWNQFLESRGINVSDIRLKITASDGSVTYRTIFNPYEEMAQFYSSNKEHKEPVDIITKFNLIYRHGLEFILKDVLHKEELIDRALKIFKFKEGEKKKESINLVQLFIFFELVGIKYVNIIDHSCRSFNSAFKIPIEKREERFKEEQKYIVKPVAFGKRLKSKRLKSKRLKSKRSKRKKPNKYSRKM
jgi:hypothetical protein